MSGPCAFCGHPAALHRLWDSFLTERRRYGALPAAAMYELDAPDLRWLANEACEVGCIREAVALQESARVLELAGRA